MSDVLRKNTFTISEHELRELYNLIEQLKIERLRLKAEVLKLSIELDAFKGQDHQDAAEN